MSMSKVGSTERLSAEDYLQMLEEAGDEVEREADEAQTQALIDERLNALGAGKDGQQVGEAIAAAAAAESPKRITPINKPLNKQQIAFAQGVIEGKTRKQSYRDAYPNAKGTDATISACAQQLMSNPRIRQMIESAWEETTEALTEDIAAQRRYVSRALVALSKSAKQEGSRLKALELLGRSAGMFKDQVAPQEKQLTADELRKELAGHLKLVAGIKR